MMMNYFSHRLTQKTQTKLKQLSVSVWECLWLICSSFPIKTENKNDVRHTQKAQTILKHLSVSVCVCLWLIFVVLPVKAENKNGVSPNTISLPSGPGSLEGLGDAYQPMLNTGMSRYSIDLKVPKAVNGLFPTITLQYDSGLGSSPLGIGWNFGPGPIKRQTDKSIPLYIDQNNGKDDDHDGVIDNPEEIDQILSPEGEELIQLTDGSYRARIERAFTRYKKIGNYWLAELKSGTKVTYGKSPTNRITDSTGTKIYAWLPETLVDVNGNTIEYIYKSYPQDPGQKYLSEIRYGPGYSPWLAYYFVSFIYEDKPDWTIDYRSGFPLRISKRLKQINVGASGVQTQYGSPGDWNADGRNDHLIRQYRFVFKDTPYKTLLASITQYGADGKNYLPPIRFDYTEFDLPDSANVSDKLRQPKNPPATLMDSPAVELVDLNRDGLPDILETGFVGDIQKATLNQGENPSSGLVQWGTPFDITSADNLARNLNLGDDKVYLSDMDGDGLADLVQKTLADDVYYFRNTGENSWDNRQRMTLQDKAPPAPFTSGLIQSSDLDFNKQMDVFKSQSDGYAVWLNLRNNRYSKKINVPGPRLDNNVVQLDWHGVSLADMNGDRLNDVVWIKPSAILYFPNMGWGEFDQVRYFQINDLEIPQGNLDLIKAQDINNDGLTDLVAENRADRELWIWVNLGADKFSTKKIVSGLPSRYSATTTTRWADINGNSTVDWIQVDSSAVEKFYYLDFAELNRKQTHPNLLEVIDNGLGVSTTISYQSSTEQYLKAESEGSPWTSRLPKPVSVVAKVDVFNALDLDTIPGPDIISKTYTYRDGYYETLEKQFRGFAQTQVVEPGDESIRGLVTNHYFFTGGPDGVDNDRDGSSDELLLGRDREEEPLKGLSYKVESRSESGKLFAIEKQNWFIANLAMGSDGREYRQARNESSIKEIYEGQETPEIVQTDLEYDEFGNIIKEENKGALSQFGDEVITETDYINDATNWLLGYPYRKTVFNQQRKKEAETLIYYDGADFTGLTLAQLTKGQVMRQVAWVKGDAGAADYVTITRNKYDRWGNIIQLLDGNDHKREITYEGLFHTFPKKETIEVGPGKQDLEINVIVDPALGIITESRDFNGHPTTYKYDTFGRLIDVVRPGDESAYPTLRYTYQMSDPSRDLVYLYDREGRVVEEVGTKQPGFIKTQQREVAGQTGTLDQIQYVDGLGRKLARIEEAESGFVVNEMLVMNTRGSPRYSYLPYFSASSSYQRKISASGRLEVNYDAMGRELLRINPATDQGPTQSTITYFPLYSRVTNENQVSKNVFLDGLGRTLEVHEENQGETYRTSYQYNTTGSLIQITDAQNNVKFLEYDGLGRKTYMNDPDKGIMNYSYDAVGNLVQTTDAKQQIINYSYDGAGRILGVDYLDQNNISPDIVYGYDQPIADYPNMANLKGNLAWIRDLSGGVFLSYDERGNPVEKIKRIHTTENYLSGLDLTESTCTKHSRLCFDAEKGFMDFRFQMAYDSMGRPVTSVWPDGDGISFDYNSRGMLESIPGYLKQAGYNEAGQYANLFYENRVRTNYDYDQRLRLKRLYSEFEPGTALQDLNYLYDRVGNITRITDAGNYPVTNPGDPLAFRNTGINTQFFQYDDLNRLTRARGLAYGTIDFRYDRIGNMVFKQSPLVGDPEHVDDRLINLGTISYGGLAGTYGREGRHPGDAPGPHAITSTQFGTEQGTGFRYEYDDNGNMIRHATGDIYHWNFQDQLTRVEKEGLDSQFVYDHAGQRVIKRDIQDAQTSVSIYVSPEFEIRNGKIFKFIFGNGKRIARVEESGDADDPVPGTTSQTLNFKNGWNFFSFQVLPESTDIETLLAGIQGKFSQVLTYDAENNTYWTYAPAEGVKEFSTLEPGKGYIIQTTGETSLTITGLPLSDPVQLQSGWNLVPSHVAEILPINQAFSILKGDSKNHIWGFNPVKQDSETFGFSEDRPDFLNELEWTEPGNAYWVHVIRPATLPFQSKSTRKITFYHPDHLGSTSLTTDEKGAIVSETAYYPFGRPRYQQTADGKGGFYKYTGKELDQTGLFYYEARYMDPVIGRFISVDPLLVETPEDCGVQGCNLYSYTINNPLILIDPTGLEPTFLDKPSTPSESTDLANDYEYYRQKFWTAVLPNDYENDPYEGASTENNTGEIEESLLGPVEIASIAKLGLSAGKATITSLFNKFVSKLGQTSSKNTVKLLSAPKTVKHHIFNKFRGNSPKSQKYRDFFKKHKIEVDKWTIEIPETMHKKQIHAMGKNWTTKWKRWIDANPNASTKEVYQFGGKLMDEFGVNNLPMVPYR
ncbi:MAG: DUF2380 domain-containing protein [Proteobacteria bacterium]|nr:DUF2380 domain-containing protein [Pseudomonadota bacterium]